ncbi:DUF4293 domain-containing protein [Pleomorphovibrio marinus]|uniref:DUF4293 domain-containing protein n=1 Tax=Pleomorphovibrio marinus TaxID=2164132 RepID=UPI000E0A72E4|nr:DUF4293 domain-containing protein [Pleomorphovibrio marinus]
MIQRKQTLFLFLVAAGMVVVAFLPIWFQVNPGQTLQLKLTAWQLATTDIQSGEIQETTNTMYIGILALASAALAIFSLLQFKNRGKQMMLNMINSLLMGVNLGLIVFVSYQANQDFNPNVTGAYVIGFYALVFALIMNLIANRFIRKDELLVRSVDRIR